MKSQTYFLAICLILSGCSKHRNEWGQIDLKGMCSGPRLVSKEDFIAQGVVPQAASDEYYWNRKDNHLTCAEMHQVESDGDLKGFWAVHVVGTNETALFNDYSDAVHWTNSRAFFQNPKQVR